MTWKVKTKIELSNINISRFRVRQLDLQNEIGAQDTIKKEYVVLFQ